MDSCCWEKSETRGFMRLNLIFIIIVSSMGSLLILISHKNSPVLSSQSQTQQQDRPHSPQIDNSDSEKNDEKATTANNDPQLSPLNLPSKENSNTESAQPTSDRTRAEESSFSIAVNGKKYDIASLDEADAERLSETLSQQQFKEIKTVILSPSESEVKRHSYLYFLMQMKQAGVSSLYEIVKSEIPQFEFQNNPHSQDARKKTLELSLRIAALEALDNLATIDPQVRSYLSQINQSKSVSDHPILNYLSSLSLASGKPGKLHRALEAIINEKEAL